LILDGLDEELGRRMVSQGKVPAAMLLSEAIPDFTKFPDAVIQYQFVAYDKSFARVAASDVSMDV
jgi:hypothetical protein